MKADTLADEPIDVFLQRVRAMSSAKYRPGTQRAEDLQRRADDPASNDRHYYEPRGSRHYGPRSQRHGRQQLRFGSKAGR